MPRYFVSKEEINLPNITFTGENAHHLLTVLRAKEGERVEVCDGCGTDYLCRVEQADKNSALLYVEESRPSQSEPKTKVILFQALPKADKMELIIQKCTELGVSSIVPVATEHCIVKLSGKDAQKKRERWQKIAEAAAKQSGRGIIPQMGDVLTFGQAVQQAKEMDLALFAYEKEEKRSVSMAVQGFSGKTVALFVGPEGGFSVSEVEKAMENGWNPITLGKRILRTETAGMASIAILLDRLEGEEP